MMVKIYLDKKKQSLKSLTRQVWFQFYLCVIYGIVNLNGFDARVWPKMLYQLKTVHIYGVFRKSNWWRNALSPPSALPSQIVSNRTCSSTLVQNPQHKLCLHVKQDAVAECTVLKSRKFWETTYHIGTHVDDRRSHLAEYAEPSFWRYGRKWTNNTFFCRSPKLLQFTTNHLRFSVQSYGTRVDEVPGLS